MKQVQPTLHPLTPPLDEYLSSIAAAHRQAQYKAWLRECDRQRIAPNPLKLRQWNTRLASQPEWNRAPGVRLDAAVLGADECVSGDGRRLLRLSTSGGPVWVKFARHGLSVAAAPLPAAC